ELRGPVTVEKEHGVVSVLRRLLGTGVLATAMMLPQAMGQRSGHHGNGSLAHHVSGQAFGGGIGGARSGMGGGIGGGGMGIGGGVGGWGFGSWGFGGWLPYYAIGVPGGIFSFMPPMLPMGPG